MDQYYILVAKLVSVMMSNLESEEFFQPNYFQIGQACMVVLLFINYTITGQNSRQEKLYCQPANSRCGCS